MADPYIKKSMRLFGIPYQFREQVDPRVSTVSTQIGKKYCENIILEAPVISIIPGKPKYLPGGKDKNITSQAIINGASGSFDSLKELLKNKKASKSESLRYYDFQRDYTDYMRYVNILCRTLAAFLEIDGEIDGFSYQRYDWSNYRWNSSEYATDSVLSKSTAKYINDLKSRIAKATSKNQTKKAIKKAESKVKLDSRINDQSPTSKSISYQTTTGGDDNDLNEMTWEEALSNNNYVQFYIDPDISYSENMENATAESKLKGLFDSGSDLFKEIAFIANSGGLEEQASMLTDYFEGGTDFLADKLSAGGSFTSVLSRFLGVGGNVVKGENMIIPDIYHSSQFTKSYSFTVHLKAPYGTKRCWFLEIGVPLMHLLALAIPKQTTANTYGSPFMIKAYVDGIFNCNIGMVSSISINKNISSDAWTVDGLPNEVDVNISIADLYSDLSMSPQSDPILFINNSSLVEYLAVTCGLNLLNPNLSKKMTATVNALMNSITDIPNNVKSRIQEETDRLFTTFLGLEW